MQQFKNKSRFSILAEDLIENHSFSKVENVEKTQINVKQGNRPTTNLFKIESFI